MGKTKKPEKAPKAAKKDKWDPVTNPKQRLLRVSRAGNAKVLATQKSSGIKPYRKYNYYANKHEFIIEFFNEDKYTSYQVIGDRLEWERVIAGLQNAIVEAENLVAEQNKKSAKQILEAAVKE